MAAVPNFVSRAAEIAAGKVAKDSARIQRQTRPAWVPSDVPDGTPFISLSAAYYDPSAPEPTMTETVTVQNLTEEEADQASARLSDAQIAGFEAEAHLRQRLDGARFLNRIKKDLP
jgi:hypothetical protein